MRALVRGTLPCVHPGRRRGRRPLAQGLRARGHAEAEVVLSYAMIRTSGLAWVRLTGDRHACLGIDAVAPCMQPAQAQAACRRVRASWPVTFVYVAAGTGRLGASLSAHLILVVLAPVY
jgi:hypothetical protein